MRRKERVTARERKKERGRVRDSDEAAEEANAEKKKCGKS